MAWDGAGTVFGVALRVARLGPTGAPAVGASNMYVTDAFTKVDLEPVYTDATSVEQKNAQGGLCLSYEGDEAVKHWNVTIEVCTPDPQLAEILGGGTILVDDEDGPIGYSFPDVGDTPHPNGLSIEVFSKAVLDGGNAPTLPFFDWIMPRVRKLRRTDTSTIGESATLGTYQGIAVGNSLFGSGPANDVEIAATRPLQYVRVGAAPTPSLDYVPVTAPA
jgi:hypothetical protein